MKPDLKIFLLDAGFTKADRNDLIKEEYNEVIEYYNKDDKFHKWEYWIR